MPANNPKTEYGMDSTEGFYYALGVTGSQAEAATLKGGSRQDLAQEIAVAFCYNGISYAVMMASPQDLEDFAYGFSLTSGVIQRVDQIVDLDVELAEDSALLHISLNQRTLNQLRLSRRTLAGTSGCGLCGVEALSQALASPEPESPAPFAKLPTPAHLFGLRERFQLSQRYREASGAMHAAIFVSKEGQTRCCREDIGRHNALDKLIGACVREGLDLSAGFVAITSRCSLELIQKSRRADIGTLVSLASPSDIAVRWARQHHLNLLHQPAQGAARLYSGAEFEV